MEQGEVTDPCRILVEPQFYSTIHNVKHLKHNNDINMCQALF